MAKALHIVVACAAILTGCAYKGGKVVEGTDFSAGISIPGTEGAAEISFVNYLSGFRFGIAENAVMECEYRGTNKFSFAWGLYEGKAEKYFKAKVEPCEVAPQVGSSDAATAMSTVTSDGTTIKVTDGSTRISCDAAGNCSECTPQ